MTRVALVIMMAMMLTGCNQGIGIGTLKFDKIHVDTHHYSGCFTVEKWHDNETGVEVKTKEVGTMFLSEGMYVLIEDECPFCGK